VRSGALAEFRIRGVSTNIPFLQAVLDDPAFVAGDVSTAFIDERPELLRGRESKDRGSKISRGSPTSPSTARTATTRSRSPAAKLPAIDLTTAAGRRPSAPARARSGRVRAALREQTALAVTETTFRDAHQSLLATRVRTATWCGRPVRGAPHPQLLSVEAWGGATYDVALRFLGEDPWERLDALREALPNVAIQMLLRGRNTVGYTPYPTQVTDAFVREAAASGVDIFRIFDALNDVSQMRPAIDAVLETGTAVAEVASATPATCSTRGGALHARLLPAPRRADRGCRCAHPRDQGHGGLLRPAAAARRLALRERFDLPVHVHTHDTAGGQLATLLAASHAGADAVDAAAAPMSGTTSQPSLSAVVAALAHTERDTGLDLQPSRPRAVLGGGAPPLPPVRVGPAGPTGASTTTRSPAVSCPTCASRRSPSASPTTSSSSRTCTPRRTTSSGASPR
jgi:pyruvate carboxylase